MINKIVNKSEMQSFFEAGTDKDASVYSFSKMMYFLLIFLILSPGKVISKEMDGVQMKDPSGVLFFSDGASILKMDLRDKSREEVIPTSGDGSYYNNTYPVYSSKRKLMYFLRKHSSDPKSMRLCVYDFKEQKWAEVFPIDAWSFSLSPSDDKFLFIKIEPGNGRVKSPIYSLVLTDLKGKVEQNFAFSHIPISPDLFWMSSNEVLYLEQSHQLVKVNLETGNTELRDTASITPSFWPLDLHALSKRLLFTDLHAHPSIRLLRLSDESVIAVVKSFLNIGGKALWNQNGTSFIYSRLSWTNFLNPYSEGHILIWYDMTSHKEVKLGYGNLGFGAFWLDEKDVKQ